MAKRPGEAVAATITVRDGTGAAVDPSPAPTCVLRRNGLVASDVVATVSKSGLPTGQYLATSAIPSGWVAGDKWELVASVIVGGVADSDVIEWGYLDRTDAQDAAIFRNAVKGAVIERDPASTKPGHLTLYPGNQYGTTGNRPLERRYLRAAFAWVETREVELWVEVLQVKASLKGLASVVAHADGDQLLLSFSAIGADWQSIPAGEGRFEILQRFPANGGGESQSIETGRLTLVERASV